MNQGRQLVLDNRGTSATRPRRSRFPAGAVGAVWLVLRVYVGWMWLDSGRQKVQDAAWMDGGSALARYWEQSLQQGDRASLPWAYSWYDGILRYLLEHEWQRWLGPAIAIGETLIGIALILGLATGLMALLGVFGFTAAGFTGNPLLLIPAVGIVFGWRVAGNIGLDHWLLPALGRVWWRLRHTDESRSLATSDASDSDVRRTNDWVSIGRPQLFELQEQSKQKHHG